MILFHPVSFCFVFICLVVGNCDCNLPLFLLGIGGPIPLVADGHLVVIWLFFSFMLHEALLQADSHGVDDLLERSNKMC